MWTRVFTNGSTEAVHNRGEGITDRISLLVDSQSDILALAKPNNSYAQNILYCRYIIE